MLARCKPTAAAHERTTMAWPHLGAFASVLARPAKSQAASAPALRVQSRGCRRRAHQEARPVRSEQWAVAVASECVSTGTSRRQVSQLFAAIPCSLAWHATWALSAVTARLVSIWGRGDRGRAAPCHARVPGSLYRSRALHCSAGRPRAHKPPKNHHRFRYVGWLVRVRSPANLLFFI